MFFPTVNRTGAERGFGIFRNVAGATITAGYPACLDVTATQIDGNRVTKPATALLSLFIGIAVATLQDQDYGKFQTYGYCGSGLVTNDASVAVAAGDILVPVNAQWYLSRSAAGNGTGGLVMAAEAFATGTTPAAANKKLFLRAL